jgi:hypothetical protein
MTGSLAFILRNDVMSRRKRLEPVYAEAQAASLELSLRNAREYRQDMARWLAAEALMTDPVACEDAMLQEHLLMLQDKIEEKMRRAA